MAYKQIAKKAKKRAYAILTTKSFRIEVQARNLQEAYREAKKEAKVLNKNPITISQFGKQDLTTAYETYGTKGISKQGFITTPKSVELWKKYKLGIEDKSPLSVLYGKVE